LCWPHRDHIERDAHQAAEVYDELALQLAPTGPGGEVTSGTRDHGLKLNPAAVEARSTIAHTFAAWTRLVAAERGFDVPAADARSMAEFVAASATWLAAHELAADCVAELRELAHGAPWRVAYPSGARTVLVGECLRGDCVGELRAVLRSPGSLLPTEITCNADETHRWPVSKWLDLDDDRAKRAA
jgi:hypothetical protein